MAIVDYATLQASVANWLARADLTSVIPDFIALAESRINRDLKVRRQQSVATGTSVNGVIALPADFCGTLSLRVAYANGSYEIFPQAGPTAPVYVVGSGLPLGYMVVGNNIQLLSGQPDLNYTLTYWSKIPALSEANQQTWLLTDEPGIYLYAALIEASPYVQDDQRTILWATQYKEILAKLTTADDYDRYGNAPAAMLSGVTP